MNARALLGAILAAGLSAEAFARETASFLTVGVGARALGMGGAYTALADDSTSIAWNPAGLAGLRAPEFSFMREQEGDGGHFDFIGAALPTRVGSFGASGRTFDQGGIDGRDAAGRPTGTFSAADRAVDLAYAAQPFENVRLGGDAKLLETSIDDASARGYSFDAGLQTRLPRAGPGVPKLGLAVQNMGPRIRLSDELSPLPLTFAAGLAYVLPQGLTLAGDYRYRPYAPAANVSLGAEWTRALAQDITGSLRAGADLSRRDLGGLAVLTLGAGLSWKRLGIEFAWLPGGALGDAFRYSVALRF